MDKRQAVNPYLPSYEYVPDGEPHLFWSEKDGDELTDPYPGDLDIILMDIEMGLMNGMEAAEKIRETDEAVVIIFVTNMAQFALRGYRVQDLDYILKA